MASPNTFRQQIVTHFSLSELKNLCQDFGIDYETIPNETIGDMARELIRYFERHLHLALLVEHCHFLRPDVDWDDAYQMAANNEKELLPGELAQVREFKGVAVSVQDNSDTIEVVIKSFRLGTKTKFIIPWEIRVVTFQNLLKDAFGLPDKTESEIAGLSQLYSYKLIKLNKPNSANRTRFEPLKQGMSLRNTGVKDGDELFLLIQVHQMDQLFADVVNSRAHQYTTAYNRSRPVLTPFESFNNPKRVAPNKIGVLGRIKKWFRF